MLTRFVIRIFCAAVTLPGIAMGWLSPVQPRLNRRAARAEGLSVAAVIPVGTIRRPEVGPRFGGAIFGGIGIVRPGMSPLAGRRRFNPEVPMLVGVVRCTASHVVMAQRLVDLAGGRIHPRLNNAA